MYSPKYVIQRSTVGGDSECHRCSDGRVRLISPPQPPTTSSECSRRGTFSATRLRRSLTSSFSQQVTIGKFSEKVLLEIFRYYLDASPSLWPRLVHICRRWRRIVFAFQQALHLRLFCTHGTPFLKTLDHWPTLSIVVSFGGSPELDPPAQEDEDNITAALKQSSRVRSISLTVRSSLLGRFSVIDRPFSELEELILLSQDRVQLTLPSNFQWSPRLRILRVTRIAIPAFPQLLFFSRSLVDLQLHEVLDPWHVSPAKFVRALSGMTQLQSLSLHFLSTSNHTLSPLPSGDRIILPLLTRFNFRGLNAYLEGLVARIDSPGLKDIEITLFLKRIFDVSKLSEFIDRIGMQKSHCRADILSSERAISMSLTQPGAPTCLKVQVLSETLSGQVYSMAQICSHFSTFIFRVEDLCINLTRPPRRQDDVDRGQWLDLMDSFTGVKWFYLAGNLSKNVVLALQPSERWRKTVLPALHKLRIREPEPHDASLRKAVVSFVYSRRLSGGFLEAEYERPVANELLGKGPFSQQAAIEILSNDTLLKIFLHCLDASPQFWPTLAHVCQNWRQIVLTSPRNLRLQLHYMHGTPLPKTLDCWPTLPVVIQYGGSSALDPPTPEDEDNIAAALKQSGRVSSISLTITPSLLEKISTISEAFLELEELVLLSQERVKPTLPSTFRWGPRLRTLHFTRITIPTLPQHLLSSCNLVELQLHDVLDPWHISPATLITALSVMTQLQSFSLRFSSTAYYIASPLPIGEHIILPVLNRLDYQGNNPYLEGLVARIDAPGLKDIEITFFNKRIVNASKLSEFIDRIDMQKSHRRADILSSGRCISISFTWPGDPTTVKVQVPCETLNGQVYSMAQICSHFSTFIFRVEDLRIDLLPSSSRQDGVDRGRWLDLLDLFTGIKWFHLAGDLSTDIVLALQPSEMRRETSVLPSLHKLCIPKPETDDTTLREAVVSLMHSCRLSGRFLAVEHCGTGLFSQQTTIEILSEDVLLKIFLHCLDTSPHFWPTLTHVCQSWRRTVLTSPRSLRLRLYYQHGRPVMKTPDFWPTLPVVVQYGESPRFDLPASEDNVVAALKQSGRVCSINLVITHSLLQKLSTISEPFLELEELVLLTRENAQLTLPRTFRWGPRLRTLHLTRVAFASFPQLLLASRDLVDLRLHEIPVGYFLPEEFVNALSGMTELRSLSLHFLSRPRNDFGLPGKRIALPALAYLTYRGSSYYLDNLVARIDTPCLGDIDITFFDQSSMDVSQLGQFIERIEILKSLSQADVQISERAISIRFLQPRTPTSLGLQILCEQLDGQLFSMGQICNHFSPFLFRVKDLRVSSTRASSGYDINGRRWLELIAPFGGAEDFRVAGELTTAILRALSQVDGEHTTTLPSLRNLCVPELWLAHGPLWDAAQLFVTSRWPPSSSVLHSVLSPTIFPVVIGGEGMSGQHQQYFCAFCNISFTERQSLTRHNGDEHMPLNSMFILQRLQMAIGTR